jgi:hypothetical protein
MGGVHVTVVSKDRPGQSVLESYVRKRPEMLLSGRLEEERPPGEFEPRGTKAELRRKDSEVEEKSPIVVYGPHRVFEDDDMDPEVASIVPAPGWQIEIGSGLNREETWEDALDLAKYIAVECRGAVWTGESGLEWPIRERKGLHGSWKKTPAVERSVDTITLEWFSHASKEPVRTGQAFLDVLKEAFPELRPYRFGTYEPLQGQLGPEDDMPFTDVWKARRADESSYSSFLFLKSRRPCLYPSVGFPLNKFSRSVAPDRVVSLKPRARTMAEDIMKVRMQLDLVALDDEKVRERVVGLFVAMARGLESFYALGYVEREALISFGGGPYAVGMKGQYPLPNGHEWFGIPPVPSWLTWFGRPYKPLVSDSLRRRGPAGISEEAGGFFVRLGERPADLNQLQAMRIELPAELLARRDEENDVVKLLAKLEKSGAQMSRSYRAKAAELIPRIDE